jgi:hypothetical protein
MTFTGVAPGRSSLRALGWLARVGASPPEPLKLVMGCSERVAYDHVRRLEADGLVKRIAMRRGHGSLIVLTGSGAHEAGHPASRAVRSVGPMTWAHACACAWVSAWLELRGRTWCSEREILNDDFWRYELAYEDHRGTARVTHRPDIAALIPAGPVAIEVELQRKKAGRLRGILAMYAQLTDDDGPLSGVIYVTDRDDVAELVARVAADVGLCSPALSRRTLDDVIAQTRAAASTPLATYSNGASR